MAGTLPRAADAAEHTKHGDSCGKVPVQGVEGLVEVDRDLALPLYEEEVEVTKQVVETGRVQVKRVTHTQEHPIDETVKNEKVEVERVPIDRPVDSMPEIRQEGDVTIFPVVAEEIVVQRRLVLKEEVRIRRVSATEQVHEVVTLRKQEAVVTRHTPEEPSVTPDV